MRRDIIASCVRGANHIRAKKPNQDAYKIVEFTTLEEKKMTIIGVADGHGSEKCPFSATGSKVAVNVFCSIMRVLLERYEFELDQLFTQLNHEGNTRFSNIIDRQWKNRIKNNHSKNKREWPLDQQGKVDYHKVFQMYGTTLLGLVITPEFIFALQIGDGDIIYVDDTEIHNVINVDKILGTETHSLSKSDAWKKSFTITRRTEGMPANYMYLISTDGFANSHCCKEEFHKSCQAYYQMTKEKGIGSVQDNLSDWLQETSILGCGDDITLVMVYNANEQED